MTKKFIKSILFRINIRIRLKQIWFVGSGFMQRSQFPATTAEHPACSALARGAEVYGVAPARALHAAAAAASGSGPSGKWSAGICIATLEPSGPANCCRIDDSINTS